MLRATVVYLLAALVEIAGCFAFWARLRLGGSAWWLAPGVGSLILFAWALTRVDADLAASLLWLWAVEGNRPDRWDTIGAAACLAGASIILLGPRPPH